MAAIARPGLGQVEGRLKLGVRNFIWASVVGSRGQSSWGIFCHFSRHINRGLDQK